MKPLRLPGPTAAISLAAFAASAQMSDQPASPSPAGGKQDAQQQDQQGQWAPEDRPAAKVPALPAAERLQNTPPQPQQENTPSQPQRDKPPTGPGTANENKADPTSQNNPK